MNPVTNRTSDHNTSVILTTSKKHRMSKVFQQTASNIGLTMKEKKKAHYNWRKKRKNEPSV